MEHEIALSEKTKNEIANPFSSGESFQKIFDIGKMFASSQLVPQIYQGKPMDCTIAVDMANRMGVSPLMVMQNLYVVKYGCETGLYRRTQYGHMGLLYFCGT